MTDTVIDVVFASMESVYDVLKAFHVEYEELYKVPNIVSVMLSLNPALHVGVCQPVIEYYMDSVTEEGGVIPSIFERDLIIAGLISATMSLVGQNMRAVEAEKQRNKPKLYGV